MTTSKKYSQEVRERAVRLVLDSQSQHESQWAAIKSVAEKIGCTAETLRKWVRQAERDSERRPGPSSEGRQRIKDLEREVRELRRANDILRKASARPMLRVGARHRRSSTADGRDGALHRRSLGGVRGRADL